MAIQKFSVTVDSQKFSVSENLYITATAVAPILKVAPVISGTSAETDVLTVTPGTWQGITLPVLTYSWESDGVAISPAETGLTYTVTAATEGTDITCTETATNAAGSDTSTSNTIAYPVNLIAPSIAGNALKGSTLTATPGTWTATPGAVVTGNWLRDNVIIPNETGLTYTLVAADEDTEIDYRETATSASGIVTQDSNAVDMWTPSQLGGLVAWYDPSDSSTITTETGVSAMADKSGGTAYNMTQPNTSLQPNQGTENGLNTLDFVDLSTTWMESNTLGSEFGTTDPAMTWHFAFDAVAAAELRTLLYMKRSADSLDYMFFGTKTGNFIIERRMSTGSTKTHSFLPEDTAFHTISIAMSDTVDVWLDGEKIFSEAAFDAGSMSTAYDVVQLGVFDTSNFGWRRDSGEIAISNIKDTDLNIIEWHKYSMIKWQNTNYVFSPAELTDLKQWLDPGDVGSLTKSGIVVTEMRDKSTNTYNAVSTGSPPIEGTQNSIVTTDYTTGTTYLQANGLGAEFGTNDTPISIHFSFESTVSADFRGLFYMKNTAAANNLIWFGTQGGFFTIGKQKDGGSLQNVQIIADDTNFHTVSLVFSSTLDVWLDGIKVVDAEAFTTTGAMTGALDFVQYGAFNSVVPWKGESGQWCVCDSLTPKAEIISLHKFWMEKYFGQTLFSFDYIVTAGQSNMVGVGDSGTAPATTQYNHFELDGVVLSTPIVEPFASGSPDNTASTGSMVGAFVNQWFTSSGRGAIVSGEAVAGSALQVEADGGSGYWGANGEGARYTTFKTNALAQKTLLDNNSVYTITNFYVLWMQGEAEAEAYNGTTISGTTYEAAFDSFITTMKTDIDMDYLVVIPIGYLDDKTNATDWDAIRTATRNSIAKQSYVVNGYNDVYTFADIPGYMSGDNIHILQPGLDVIGTQTAINLDAAVN